MSPYAQTCCSALPRATFVLGQCYPVVVNTSSNEVLLYSQVTSDDFEATQSNEHPPGTTSLSPTPAAAAGVSELARKWIIAAVIIVPTWETMQAAHSPVGETAPLAPSPAYWWSQRRVLRVASRGWHTCLDTAH